MMRRPAAIALVPLLCAAACSGSGTAARPAASSTEAPTSTVPVATRSISFQTVSYAVGQQVHLLTPRVSVVMTPASGALDVAVSRKASVAWHAAAWNAVATATLLNGSGFSGRKFTFHADDQPIDGTSTGGLLTVAVLALLRGDTLRDGITMTGTISPDGSIGPVGGVAHKVDAAKSLHIATLLVP